MPEKQTEQSYFGRFIGASNHPTSKNARYKGESGVKLLHALPFTYFQPSSRKLLININEP